MKENFKRFVSCLDYKSLVLLNQACKDLKDCNSQDVLSIEELSEIFMKDEELEQDVKYNKILKRVPASGEEFAYSIKNFKTEYLWDLIEFFGYTYSITKKSKYYRVCECINIILKYRKQLQDLAFSQCENMDMQDLELYLSLIPKNIKDEIADYMQVIPRDITKEYLEEYGKVKSIGRQ